MANRPHIPKFGDWSQQQNVPFTMVFDDASKKKRTGQSHIRNPNDPNENPALFSDHRSPARPNRRPESRNPQIPSRERHEQVKINEGGGGGEFRQFAESPARSEKSSRVKAPAAEPPNDRRYGGRDGNQTDVTGQPRSAALPPRSPYNSSSQGSSASVGRATQIPNVRGQVRGRAIPQFGSWDNSIAADEGYTQIFENARKDKNRDGGKPVIGTPSSTPSHPINDHRSSPPGSPKTCCFPWGGRRKH